MKRKFVLVIFVVLALWGMWSLQVFTGDGFRVYALCYIPVGCPELPVLKVSPERLDTFALRRGLYGDTPIAGLRAGSTVIFNHGGSSLRVFENAGGFMYDTLASFGPWDEWQGGDMQAGQLMQDYVYKTGGFPATIEYEKRTVHRQGLFVTGYTFIYRQWFLGQPGLGFGGLRVSLGNGSLVRMLRSIHQVEGEYSSPRTVISARSGLKIAVRNMQVCTDYAKRFFVHGVRLGYFTLMPEVRQEMLEPVWEIRFTGHTIYVNAHTGELMFGDGSRYTPN